MIKKEALRGFFFYRLRFAIYKKLAIRAGASLPGRAGSGQMRQ
ncbi:hypothetical protein ANACOL_01651 [Anaerotruncus colihominis DSM 17241]|jgi:hypothetical protein|uniref:Uncharacterized protein n=1 Tax=Anaerotruncus colihominis DSM 17241 TaxID=445972 RepID=B0PA82_9FIRM|nr:hypothetical protein [Anaerotruncus colihominis]EDS11760.1 hypothetical protein ANACOL_01651 [Anaerotruncus colihominis DSM 17241]